MDEKSYHEKNVTDKSTMHRLSESRPTFKPVLVKKLLADESDDDSDEPASNNVNSDEDADDFDSFQPLPQESIISSSTAEPLSSRTDFYANKSLKTEVSDLAGCEKLSESTSVNKKSDIVENKGIEQQPVFNTYVKDSEYGLKKVDNEFLFRDKVQSVTKHNYPMDTESATLKSQWQPTTHCTNILEKQKSSVRESVESNIIAHSSVATNIHEIKDRPLQHIKDIQDKVSKIEIENVGKSKRMSQSATVVDTPMKVPQETTRPNPCNSHRNIFQTPQNKMNNEFGKTPHQTPATIFSHWSQHHMAQTPMQNQIYSSRKSLSTPAVGVAQLQNRHETPRYCGTESKTVRRPLETVLPAIPHHGSQLSKVQEVSNEIPMDPSTLNTNHPIKENVDNEPYYKKQEKMENQPLYSVPHLTKGHKENQNPNSYLSAENESNPCNQQKMSVIDSMKSNHPYVDSNLKLEYNMQHPSRPIENTYKNYQIKENQSIHPCASQAEQISSRQRPIQANITCFPKLNRVIKVKNSQYLVLGKLGQGMSGEVLWVYDAGTSEARAIKCVDLRKMDKEAATGCLHEIRMLDQLRAPCIVHMYSFEIVNPMVYVVMEVGDTDLSHLIKSIVQEKKKVPLATILYYWMDMLTAVQHIHKEGVIHSDLKPANFLFVRGRLKLIDFGIASTMNADMTSVLKDNAIGTLNYISPEALMDVNTDCENNDSPNHKVKYKISFKSDVWSLGCILYQLVYGTTPFSHIRQQWAKIRTITDPKHKINFSRTTGADTVPLILIEVMKKCLQFDLKSRPTVTELLEIPYLQSNISGKNLSPNISIKKILLKIKRLLSKEEWDKFSEDYSIVPTATSKDFLLKIKHALSDDELYVFTEEFK